MGCEEMKLADACVPILQAGNYKITASYRLSVDKAATDETSRTLTVTAPRFTLAPGEVLRCYPPSGSAGPFSTTLPHVTLGRPTLPWERLRGARNTRALDGPQPKGSSKREPWMVLLVFGPGEVLEDPQAIGHVTTTTVGEWQRDQQSLHADLGPLNDKEYKAACRTIRIAPEVFRALVPSTDDLRYLAHVRQAPPALQKTGGLAGMPETVSVVTGNRLPRPPERPAGHSVAHVAHLVSLEGLPVRLDGLAGKPRENAGPSGMPVRLLSLHSWSFINQAIAHPPFSSTMTDLVKEMETSSGLLRLSVEPEGAPGMLSERLQSGLVPVRAAAKTENAAASGNGSEVWHLYRGPLSPVPATDVGPVGKSQDAGPILPGDVDDSRFASDISHAAAWNLGRALALASTDIFSTVADAHRVPAPAGRSSDLLDTKIEQGLSNRLSQSLNGPRNSPGPPAASPQTAELADEPAPKPEPPCEADLSAAAELLAKRLHSLRALPFCHLVPHPDMLPHESVRFFHVDEYWVHSLLQGASSVAASRPGATSSSLAKEAVTKGRATAKLRPGEDHRTGVLIRSRLIAQYPGLRIEAGTKDRAVTVQAWNPAPDVLMCLFDSGSDVTWFEIREPEHALHLGFEEDEEGSPVLHTRDRSSGDPSDCWVEPDKFLRKKTGTLRGIRTVDFARLAQETRSESPAALALQLIRTPHRQVFGERPSLG